jgi:hypothetical protein
MHAQGFGGIIIQRMQILEENTGGLGGLTSLKILKMYDCEALEEFPCGICTLKASKELIFTGCESLRKILEGLRV